MEKLWYAIAFTSLGGGYLLVLNAAHFVLHALGVGHGF